MYIVVFAMSVINIMNHDIKFDHQRASDNSYLENNVQYFCILNINISNVYSENFNKEHSSDASNYQISQWVRALWFSLFWNNNIFTFTWWDNMWLEPPPPHQAWPLVMSSSGLWTLTSLQSVIDPSQFPHTKLGWEPPSTAILTAATGRPGPALVIVLNKWNWLTWSEGSC